MAASVKSDDPMCVSGTEVQLNGLCQDGAWCLWSLLESVSGLADTTKFVNGLVYLAVQVEIISFCITTIM